jgi:pimeloyl-ACP methyl ester carboxylesterase
MAVTHQNGSVRSGDIDIFYRRLGRRGQTPCVLVHGLSYFSYDWLEFADALGARRECAALDMRGFGDSDWSKDYSVPSMAQDIAQLLDHLGWERAILFGHSMGGRSAAYLAAKQPQRVACLVLVDYTPENAPAGSKRVATTVAGTPDVFASVDAALEFFKAGPEKRARYEAYLKPVAGGYAINATRISATSSAGCSRPASARSSASTCGRCSARCAARCCRCAARAPTCTRRRPSRR